MIGRSLSQSEAADFARRGVAVTDARLLNAAGVVTLRELGVRTSVGRAGPTEAVISYQREVAAALVRGPVLCDAPSIIVAPHRAPVLGLQAGKSLTLFAPATRSGASGPTAAQEEAATALLTQRDDGAEIVVERGAPGLPLYHRLRAVALGVLSLIAVAVSVLISLLWTTDARAELATLSAVGADRSTISRLVSGNAGGLTALAAGCGVTVGLFCLLVVDGAGTAVSLNPAGWVLLLGAAACVASVGAATVAASHNLVLARRDRLA